MTLIEQQRAIVVGLMLGDGHLETQNQGRTYRLKIEQSFGHREYVDWLYGQLGNLGQTPPRAREQTRVEKVNKKYGFNTLSLASLQFYGQLFYTRRDFIPRESRHNADYRNGEKVVPKMIGKLVTPLSLAVWFMDDGSIKSAHHRAKILNTQAFDSDSIENLRQMLATRFRIDVTLRKQKDGIQLYIPSTEIKKFVSLVEEYIVPSMRYKLS
ncbi:MAG: LAGLIDADG endonuclease [Patescibacteria group bacterium]